MSSYVRMQAGVHTECAGLKKKKKWKLKFEPQVYNCVTCSRHRWQTCLRGYVLSPMGGYGVISVVHMGPWHALNLIIVLHYLWVPQPLQRWHMVWHLSPAQCIWSQGPVPPVNAKKPSSEPACLTLKLCLLFCLLLLLWYLKQFPTWNCDSSYTHTSTMSLSSRST